MSRFLGMYVYYYRFVQMAAEILKPLYQSLVKVEGPWRGRKTSSGSPKPKPKKKLVWTQETAAAFQREKNTLVEATQLSYPVSGAKTAITMDANDLAVGAVLEQHVDGQWRLLGFFSHQLKGAELRYRGPFNNYVNRISPFFYHPPTPSKQSQ